MPPGVQPVVPLGVQPRLNGLRGIAVSLVLAYHLWPTVFQGGFVGVDLFFVLSGFLITSLLAEEHAESGRIRLGRFYGRRALRLLPALYVCLLAVAVDQFVVHPADDPLPVITFLASTVLNVSNFVVASAQPIYAAHVWSLSFEEQFYLLWPPLMGVFLAAVLAGRRRPGTLIRVLVCLALASALVRAAGFVIRGPHGWLPLHYSPFTRADGLLIGCALGLARTWGMLRVPSASRARWLVLGGLAALTLATFTLRTTSGLTYLGGLTVAVAGAAVAVLVATTPDRVRGIGWLASRPLTYVGGISYALYIWSGILFYYFEGSFGERILGLAVVFAIAVVSSILVERPALRLKARLAPSKHMEDVALQPLAAAVRVAD